MCKAMEDMRNEAERIGIEKRCKDQTVKFVLSILEDGSYSYEQIARITELTVEEIKALDEKRTVCSFI